MVGRGWLFASTCFAWFATSSLFAQTASWKIEADSPEAKPGQPVTLHVTSPDKPSSGRLTLFDGAFPLGTITFNDRGEAMLRTNLLAPGAHSIRAVRWGTPASASPALSITVSGDQPARYSKEKTYPAGPTPGAITVADFDGDGNLDLAVTNSNSGSITVLLGASDGSFGDPIPTVTGAKPTALVAADLDGDGITDLAVTDSETGSVNILIGVGDGTFSPRRDIALSPGTLSAIVAADFDGDGVPDLAVANQSANNVAILIGNGDGTFQAPRNISVGSPSALAAADFNEDGIADLAVANFDSNTVTVLLGTGNLTFQALSTSAAGDGPAWLGIHRASAAAGMELSVGGARDATLTVLPANANGTLGAGRRRPFGYRKESNVSADFNHDGTTQLAVADPSGKVRILAPLASTDPDLTITKTHSGNFFQNQTGGVYTIVVKNSGGGSTSGTITVTDTLPVGLTATAISGPNWICTLATLTCTNVGTFGAGSQTFPISVTVNVAANAPASLTNTATVSGGGETDTTNDTASDLTLINGPPDLTITKTHSGNFFQNQTGGVYSIVVKNTGGGPTSGTITVTDTLPAGMTATGISGPNWICTLGTLTCTNVGTFPVGSQTFPISVTVNVAANATSPLVNTATVSGGGELDATNDTATDSTIINGPPDLTITKTHTGNFFQNQTGGVYSIVVKNTGGGPTSGTITVTDTLPAGMTATAISGPNWICTLATLTCTNVGTFTVGSQTFPISVTVNVAANATSPLVNTATVSGGGELDATNDTATDSTIINGPPDLTITKTHTGNFFQNQTGGVYSIVVKNTGGGPTSGTITVTDTLPAGMTATAISGPNWICTLATLTCTNVGTFAVGSQTFPIAVTVNVASNATSPLVNTATVSGGGELDATNDTATDSTIIGGPPDLVITKTHIGNFFQNQTGGIYSIVVKNTGGGPTSGTITVTDTLPAGMTATAISGGNWNCTLATLTCTNVGSFAVGSQTFPVNVTVNVAANATSPLVNTATVSGGGELDATNDTATDSTIINGSPDLTISKTHTGNFFQNQTGGVYSIVVKNTGGGPTSGTITVTDTLPVGMTATAIGGPNWICTLATLTCTNTGTFPVGSQTFPISVTVNVAANATSPLVNTATVSGGGELDATNDTATDSTIINGSPDLTITKTHTGNFFQNQTGGVYSIVVKNTGGGPTSGTITVTDTLPAGMTATAMSGGNWICTLATHTCTNTGSFAVGSQTLPINVTVNVAANATSPLVNTATVSGGGETNTSNDTAIDSTIINSAPDLTIAKSHSGNFFQNQIGAAYSIVVTNTGGGSTNGTVTVIDTLPAGLTATAISGPSWICTLATLTCTNSGVLAAGGNYSAITVTVNVAANATGPVINNATVSGGGETNTANNSASDSTIISAAPDLVIVKTHAGNFTQGQTGASYSLVVTNAGAGPTNGAAVTVTDMLPTGLSATAISGANWNCTLATMTCTNSGILAANSSYSPITVTVSVAANAPASVTNNATVSGGGELNTANDSASDPTTVTLVADLTITKSHTGNFVQGQTGATYSIAVTNAGPGPTNGAVSVVDTLPVGLSATAISGTAWNCTLGTLSCTRNDALAATASYPAITVTVNVASNAAASVTNNAVVSGGGELNTANDSASDPTTVTLVADLTITKSHSGNFVQGQTGATYSITVTNAGPGPTNGAVSVVDTLPAGLSATAISGTAWNCTLGTLSCTRNDALAATASYPAITVTVNVASNAAASVTNNAVVSGGGELNTANDSASDPTTVTLVADLTITKSHSGNFVQGQTGATYSITVTNAGPGPTNGAVSVVDTLPAGLSATAISGTAWNCTLGTLSCTRNDALAATASYPAIIVTVNVAANAPTSLTNNAAVSGGGELNTSNDTASDPTTIGNGPDLIVTKTHSGNFTQGQTGAQYTITVKNTGGTPTSGAVNVVDTLPAGLTATAINGTAWNCTLGTLSCTRNDALAATASYPAITVTVNVASNAAASVTNNAVVSGGGEINAANDTASDPTTITPVADLTITKSHSGNFVQGQTGATYSITVTNAGPGPTNGAVSVVDTLPTGLSATAISGANWNCTLATMTCTNSGILAANSSYSPITVTVSVAANAPASVTNNATVSGGGELNTSNDTASDPTTIGNGPDLIVTKTHSGNFTQGQTGAQYTITVKNTGGSPTTAAVTAVDTLPVGLSATAISGTAWNCTLGTLSCTRNDALAATASYPAITVTVNVAANAPTSLTNNATVSGGGELNTANDSASDPTTIGNGPDLTITKTHSGNFTQGQTGAQYTITVKNAGGSATSGAVTVTDTLPVGLSATAISGTAWNCTLGTLSCTRNDALAATASYPAITVTVNVASNAAASVTNNAVVSGGGELNTANDSASDPTTVTLVADLTITKSHSGNFVQGQTGATYSITVTNAGPGPTNGAVSVVDTLPAGLSATAISGTAWNCTLGTLSCTRNDALAATASYPAITVTVNVASNAAASVTNNAVVSGGGELNTANDSASDPTTVTLVADLTITKSHSGNFVQGQTGATYSITVTNAGPGPTNGAVSVVDTLPVGLSATAISGTAWNCTLGTLSCTRNDALAATASYPAIIVTVNVAANAPTSLTNNAAVSGGGELNTSNDTASDPTTIGNGPDLIVTKTHSGNFTQGQTGAQYTITVKNTGSTPTSGAVNVVDTLPAGLSATAISGTAWNCTLGTLSCTRNDALAATASYPAITVTVNVASNAAASVTNNAVVSGGGEINAANDTASDPTTITLVADLTITKSHSGNFVQGQTGATYSIAVTNAGPGPTNGAVSVVDTLPVGLSATAISGTAWNCTLGTLSCTRNDALAPNASYPTIIVAVNVATNAPSGLTNTVTVFGGGELNTANDSASDPTTIVPNLVDVSGLVRVTTSGFLFSRSLHLYTGTMTVTNISNQPINGPMQVVLTNLTPGVTLSNATATALGGPYMTLPGVSILNPGQSATVGLTFGDPANLIINFTPVTFSGSF